MTPYEILLSESQERMLLVARKGTEEEIRRIFDKWDLDAVVVGHVTDDSSSARLSAAPRWRASRLRRSPRTRRCTSGPPPSPASQDQLQHLDIAAVPEPKDLGATLKHLLASPNIASKSGSFVSTIITCAATPWWRPAPMPQ